MAYQNYTESTGDSSRNSHREPQQTSKHLQASFTADMVIVHDSTIRKRLGEIISIGESKAKPLLTKWNIMAHFTFAKKHLDDPQDFWDNVLWTDYLKVELFGRHGSSYIWLKAKTTFNIKNIISTWWW